MYSFANLSDFFRADKKLSSAGVALIVRVAYLRPFDVSVNFLFETLYVAVLPTHLHKCCPMLISTKQRCQLVYPRAKHLHHCRLSGHSPPNLWLLWLDQRDKRIPQNSCTLSSHTLPKSRKKQEHSRHKQTFESCSVEQS